MALLKYDRRCGNTTRQVDEWIQELFSTGQCVVIDHAHREGNEANRCAERVLLRRLKVEHGLTVYAGSPLIWSENTKTLSLLPF